MLRPPSLARTARGIGILLVAVIVPACLDAPVSPRGVTAPPILFSVGLDGLTEVAAIRPDGGGRRELTANAAYDAEAVWSPDSRLIAFTSNRPVAGQAESLRLFLMTAGGELEQLAADTPIDGRSPDWSSDGSAIVFTRQRAGGDAMDIWVIQRDGSDPAALISDGITNASPRWSPNETAILFTSVRDGREFQTMYLSDADGSNVRVLAPDACAGHVRSPRWSPTGNRIAYTCSDATGSVVYLMDADGTEIERLSPSGTQTADSDAVWSPDGTRIVFVRAFDLYVMSLADRTTVRLTTDGARKRPTDWR